MLIMSTNSFKHICTYDDFHKISAKNTDCLLQIESQKATVNLFIFNFELETAKGLYCYGNCCTIIMKKKKIKNIK